MDHVFKKCPNPENFRSKRVCISPEEAASVQAGDTVEVIVYRVNGKDWREYLRRTYTQQEFAQGLVAKGDYFLLRY